MTHEIDRIELLIKPEGSLEKWKGWRFGNGSYCGKANDSVSVSFEGLSQRKLETVMAGGVFTREDVIRLRDFLTVCIGSWQTPPPPLFGLMRKACGLPEKPDGRQKPEEKP